MLNHNEILERLTEKYTPDLETHDDTDGQSNHGERLDNTAASTSYASLECERQRLAPVKYYILRLLSLELCACQTYLHSHEQFGVTVKLAYNTKSFSFYQRWQHMQQLLF